MTSTSLRARSVEVDGVALRALVSDTGTAERPPVVLVHGVGVSSRNMEPAARCLRERGFPVVVPDLPGHGGSGAPARTPDVAGLARSLVGLAAELGLQRPAWLGNSFGCQVIVEVAAQQPTVVRCAVLQGPTCDPDARSWGRQIGRWVRNGLRERSTQHDVTFADWRRAGLARLVVTARHSLQHRIEDRLPLVTAPVLVVRGSRDPIVSQVWASQAARLPRQGRLLTLPGATHTVTTTEPDRLVAAVTPFLDAGGHT